MNKFEQFCMRFSNEDDCIDAFFSIRWPNGFSCPRCDHRHYSHIRTRRLPLYQCSSCSHQTSLISGTLFEGSRTPLRLWLQALFLHAQPNGISAAKLSEVLGTTYKTAWLICHKIRHAMSQSESSELLSGIVHVNSSVYGRPHNPTIYRHPQEQPLLAGASILSDGTIEQIKIIKVPQDHLQDANVSQFGGRIFVLRHVCPLATNLTVVTPLYGRNRYKPLIDRCNRATNWINNIFHGVSSKHLQSYLDQYCYVYNSRARRDEVFSILLRQCTITPTIKYPSLLLREDISSQLKLNYAKHLKRAS